MQTGMSNPPVTPCGVTVSGGQGCSLQLIYIVALCAIWMFMKQVQGFFHSGKGLCSTGVYGCSFEYGNRNSEVKNGQKYGAW